MKKWKQWGGGGGGGLQKLQKLIQPVTWTLVGADILLNLWRYMSIEGQGHFLTLDQGRVHSKIQTRFSQKLLCCSEWNFVWTNTGTRKFKVDNMVLANVTPIYGKNPSKILLWNRSTDFHETWYVALGTPAHHNLFKWWPWSDLDLFYGKGQIW